MKLYGYFRSSAAWRVRIGLHLKGLEVEHHSVPLGVGAQREPDYLALNPQGLVPTLVDGDRVLGQSLAILEYLEETHPDPPLLPGGPADRARIRQLALVIACETHALQNLRVPTWLRANAGFDEARAAAWCRHWIESGLASFEGLLHHAGDFAYGDAPTLADVCLVPQLANARRFRCDLSGFPNVVRIDTNCAALDAFASAAPDRQPDAPKAA